ncbi:MAG: DAK2 domain-containing protein [Anaerolineae bacterium]|nr:DAK2 domain-containing protein [Anaerolineae bacterium]MDW8070808.1 DAK2 domain-containing protein [Anaerolineae bacterium]
MARSSMRTKVSDGNGQVRVCDGHGLRQAMKAAGEWLQRHVAEVNALNVFPVPDGDTGTNMALTMAAALAEVETSADGSAASVAQALARGGLMGARGNSGVILSQILRGLAHGLADKKDFSVRDLAVAVQEAYETALRGIIRPVEGTILTVMRTIAESIRASSTHTDDILTVLSKAVEDARETNRRTPEMLPVLREAGVVDAGGQGLVYLLEGMVRFLRGEPVETDALLVEESIAKTPFHLREPEAGYGYDVQFLIHGERLDVEQLRHDLERMGDSVLVVGDARLVKVHIHTHDPGRPLSYGAGKGTLSDVVVENMQAQYQHFVQRQRTTGEDVAEIAIVSVASGEGLTRIMESLGVSHVIPGGQTMNPSIQEILSAIEATRANKVLVLPNNGNVIAAAEQACRLSSKQALVVPTRSIPQGIAALLDFNYQANLETNQARMTRSAAKVRTIEITRAVRSSQANGMRVTRGDIIGLLDETLVASGTEMTAVTLQTLEHGLMPEHSLATVYFGQEVDSTTAMELAETIRARYPHLSVEVHEGGQPHYHYIISLE